MIKSTPPQKQTRHSFICGCEGYWNRKTTFLYFQKCYETAILHKCKGDIKTQQGHSDILTSRFAIAVNSAPQKQSKDAVMV